MRRYFYVRVEGCLFRLARGAYRKYLEAASRGAQPRIQDFNAEMLSVHCPEVLDWGEGEFRYELEKFNEGQREG